ELKQLPSFFLIVNKPDLYVTQPHLSVNFCRYAQVIRYKPGFKLSAKAKRSINMCVSPGGVSLYRIVKSRIYANFRISSIMNVNIALFAFQVDRQAVILFRAGEEAAVIKN